MSVRIHVHGCVVQLARNLPTQERSSMATSMLSAERELVDKGTDQAAHHNLCDQPAVPSYEMQAYKLDDGKDSEVRVDHVVEALEAGTASQADGEKEIDDASADGIAGIELDGGGDIIFLDEEGFVVDDETDDVAMGAGAAAVSGEITGKAESTAAVSENSRVVTEAELTQRDLPANDTDAPGDVNVDFQDFVAMEDLDGAVAAQVGPESRITKCFEGITQYITELNNTAHIGGETILFGRPVRYWTSGALLTGGTCLNQFKGHAVDTQTQKWADSSGRYKTADAAVQSAIHELFNGMKDDGVIF